MNLDQIRSIQIQHSILRSSLSYLTHLPGTFKEKLCKVCNWSPTSFYIKIVQLPNSVSIADNAIAILILEKHIHDLIKSASIFHKDIPIPTDETTNINLELGYPKCLIYNIYDGIITIKEYLIHRLKEDLLLSDSEFLHFRQKSFGTSSKYFQKDLPINFHGISESILKEIITQLYFLKEHARSSKRKAQFVIEETCPNPTIIRKGKGRDVPKVFKRKNKTNYVKAYGCSTSK